MPVVSGYAEALERPIDEDEAGEDRVTWYGPERAAVLRDAAVVAEDVVLLRPEMDGRESPRASWKAASMESAQSRAASYLCSTVRVSPTLPFMR
jgi:hypothetical protein